MKLDRELIANEALSESIDLESVHLGLIEAVAFDLYATKCSSGYIVDDALENLVRVIRSIGYGGLRGGQWRTLIHLPPNLPSYSPIDAIESLIEISGRFCRIDTKKKIRELREALKILSPDSPVKYMLLTVIETAVQQALERHNLRAPEHDIIQDEYHEALIEEYKAISQLVLEKTQQLLGS